MLLREADILERGKLFQILKSWVIAVARRPFGKELSSYCPCGCAKFHRARGGGWGKAKPTSL